MNIISNTCLGALLYHKINQTYQNPFCWNVIDYNSFYYLIDNYNKINFNNYELKKDNNWNFYILIDKKIKIQYVHYRFKKDENKKINRGINVYWNKIWEYIVKKYEERLKRMLLTKEKPIFILGSIHKKHWYNKKQVKSICELCTKKGYKLVVVNNNIDFSNEFTNIKFIKTIHTEKDFTNGPFAKEIYPQIKKYLNS